MSHAARCRSAHPTLTTASHGMKRFRKKHACELRDPLSKMEKVDLDLSAPSDDEWELLEAVARVLGIFEEAVQMLCGVNYPTLTEVVQICTCLLVELEGTLGMHNDEARSRERAAIIDKCSPSNERAPTDAIQVERSGIRIEGRPRCNSC